MTRAGTGSQAPPGAVSPPASRADTCIRAMAGVIVAGSRTNEIFIENGRFHGRQIAKALAAL